MLNLAQAGYVSHSFNQFVQTDGDYVFRVDHGDAYPRAVVLTRCETDGRITDISYSLPLSINGYMGDNATGVSIGGLELSSENCLIVGNSVDQSDENNYSADGQRNIFLSVSSKQLNSSDMIWLTDYKEDSDIAPYTPSIVKLNEEQFLVMWEEYHRTSKETTVQMVTINAEGTLTSKITETNLRLSDCAPVRTSDGQVKWYVTDQKTINFCMINPYQLSSIHDQITIMPAVTSIRLDMSNLSMKKGEVQTLTAKIEPQEAASANISWVSSNTEVATVENGKVTAKGAGSAVITAKAGEKEAICKVTVEEETETEVKVEKITLNKTNLTLTKGKSTVLKAP